MARVLIFCPIFRFKEQEAIENHRKIIQYSMHEVDYLKVTGHSVEHGKSLGYREFLKKDYDYFFNIDADIISLDPKNDNPIDRLISTNKDIVGGVYVVKRPPYFPAHRTITLQSIWEKEGKAPENYIYKIPKELHKVQWLAGGCILVKREVIEKLTKNHQIPNLPMVHNKQYLSEDWAFCKRARDEGYEIWADPTIKIGHLGRYSFTLKDYYEHNLKNGSKKGG